MVLHDAFVDLVEYVGRDALEDVGVWQIGPEGLIHGAKALRRELRRGVSTACSTQELRGCLMISCGVLRALTSLLAGDQATRTPVFLAAGDQALLRVVGDVRCKDGIDTTDVSICARHQNSGLPSSNEGVHDFHHARVEQAIERVGACRVLETGEFADRYIP